MQARGASRWLRLASAVVLGGALASHARAAFAEEPEARRRILLVILAEDGEATESATLIIAAHLRELAVELAVVREPHDPGTRAAPEIATRSHDLAVERHASGVLWVGAGPSALSLYLYEREGDRLFERRVPVEKGQSAAAVESLALIAQAASAELLEGKVATMTPVASPASTGVPSTSSRPDPAPDPPQITTPPPAVPVTPEAARPPPAAKGLAGEGPDRVARGARGSAALSGGYLGNMGGHNVPWQSAFAVELGWHPSPRTTFGLGYEIALPDAPSPGALASSRHPIFAAGGYHLLFTPRWDLELGSRAVVDFITHTDVRMLGAATTASIRGSLGPTADVGLRILPALRLGLLLGMDVVLDPPGGMGARAPALSDRLQLVSGLGVQIDLEATPRDAPRITASAASPQRE